MIVHRSIRALRPLLAALALALAAVAPFACLRPTSITCPSGLVCPADTRCPPDGGPNVCLAGPSCGNRVVEGAELGGSEECDDGNDINEDNCTNSCRDNFCGDGYVDSEEPRIEECDPGLPDGGLNTDGGPPNTASCNSNCTISRCGDGFVNPAANEICDDGNTDACGTCSPNCQQAQLILARATGTITVTATVNDGATLTINDGINSVLFSEFDTDGSCISTSDRICINVPGATTNDVAARIAAAINSRGVRLLVMANQSSNQVQLTHDLEGQIGNGVDPYAIVTLSPGVMGLALLNLSDGTGYDCPTATGCVRNEDCRTRYCSISAGKERGTCEQCQTNTDCQPGYCDRGLCQPFECQTSADCLSINCNNGACR
jgi:cysteine-rich repeat protein